MMQALAGEPTITIHYQCSSDGPLEKQPRYHSREEIFYGYRILMLDPLGISFIHRFL